MPEPQQQGKKPKSLLGWISAKFHRKEKAQKQRPKETITLPQEEIPPEGPEEETSPTRIISEGLPGELSEQPLSDLEIADLVTGMSLINIFERFGGNQTPSERKAMIAVIQERCPWYFSPVQESTEYRDRGDLKQALDILARIDAQGREPGEIPPRGAAQGRARGAPRTMNAEAVDQLRAIVQEFDVRTAKVGGDDGKKAKGPKMTFG